MNAVLYFYKVFSKNFWEEFNNFLCSGSSTWFWWEKHLPHFIIKEIFQFLHFCLNAALHSKRLASLTISWWESKKVKFKALASSTIRLDMKQVESSILYKTWNCRYISLNCSVPMSTDSIYVGLSGSMKINRKHA